MGLKAKGLLSIMLSMPNEWDFSVLGLAALSRDGKDAIMSSLSELRECGYLKMTRVQKPDGKFTAWEYDVYESPYLEEPQSENPSTEKPYAGKPNTENPHIINTNSINGSKEPTININTDSFKEKEKKEEDSFVAPELKEVWQSWLTHRKQSGKPYKSAISKESAYKKLMKLANDDIYTAERIIMQSLENAWLGFFELKDNGTRQQTTTGSGACQDGARANRDTYREAGKRIDALLAEKLGGHIV